MNADTIFPNQQFLSGGGEMGALTRAKDWSTNAVGPMEIWPQSLRTTLSIVLNSKFPMFLWWGPQLTCFYNDAYRPSLGQDGKHPSILGEDAKDAWPEIWDIIKPLIDQVLAGGEATWSEDQLIPIFRNGKLEDVYWTFSYSPVNDESGKVGGVLVTCSETTDKINTLKRLSESERRFRNVADSAPVLIWMSDTDKLCYFFNIAWLNFTGRTMAQEEGNGWAEGVHPDDLQRCLDIYITAFDKRESFYMEYRLKRHDGEYRWISDNGVSRMTCDGTFEGYIGACMDIHEQTIHQKKVEDAEERLRLATEATELGTWDLDLQTGEIVHSVRLAEIFGHEGSKKLKHFDLRNQIHPDDEQEIVVKAFERAMQTSICEYEARMIKPNNEVCWIRTRGKVFFDKDKKPVKMLGTIRDITKERRHQEVLKESEEKFRLLADSMPQHVWTSGPDGNLNYFNKSVFDYSGLTPEQIYTEGWMQIVHPDDREENTKKWTSSISTGTDFLIEHRFRRYDGEYRWQLSRAIPQKDADGNIQMWVGTSTDIQRQKEFASELEKEVQVRTKELKQLNEALIKSEAQYHLMVEEVQDYAILYLNREGIIENWNKGAEKIKGYSPKEIIGKNFSVFYTKEDRNKNTPFELLEGAANIGKALQEGWRVRKDGTLFWASVVITAVHDPDNKVIGFSKVTHDLTEKKEAEDQLKKYAEELKQKNKDLEKMNAELQSFAYISSHDLQEPLRKIQTFATRIIDKEKGNLSETGKDYFERIQRAASRMQTLIEDLLTYSRTNTTDLVFQKTDLSEIAEEIKNDFKETLAEKKAIIEIGKMCEANVIHFQFRQLMTNLIGNALKFSKSGQPAIVKIKSELVMGSKLKLEALSPKKQYCHLTISDNGIGFDPTYKDRIFEVFQRLHSKDEYAGTGIGLAIVKKIVDNHHGIITATGELNEGATFDIYIPA